MNDVKEWYVRLMQKLGRPLDDPDNEASYDMNEPIYSAMVAAYNIGYNIGRKSEDRNYLY